MLKTHSPIKCGKLIVHYPLAQLTSKLQLPFANLLLVSAQAPKRKAKKCESSKMIATPIHHKQQGSGRTGADTASEDNSQLRQFSKLRISVLNERKKKKIESFKSTFYSIYDRNITKSKSQMLKKDFECAFKKMIGKKQISSKEKQLKASQELWNSMNLKKEQGMSGLIVGEHPKSQYSRILHNRNNSQKKLLKKTINSFYNYSDAATAASNLSRLYLTGHQFHKSKVPAVRLKDREMPDQHLRNCIPFKLEGQIKPWNNESRRYKTQVNEGKSGEITEWLKASRHC